MGYLLILMESSQFNRSESKIFWLNAEFFIIQKVFSLELSRLLCRTL
jgi:hypothetical protein